MSPNNHTLDITTLETWLWEATCKIRGPVDAPKFKDYILPLVFLIGVIDAVDFNATQAGQRKRATAGCGNWCSTGRHSRGALRCAWTRESLSPPQDLR